MVADATPTAEVASQPEDVAATPGVAPDEATTIIRPTGFARSRIEVSEADSFVRLVVTAPPGLTSEFPVQVSLAPGTATVGEDFLPPARSQLTFAPGETEAIVFVPLIGDTIGEYIEDFTVRLEAAGDELAFENASALVIIVDDDQAAE